MSNVVETLKAARELISDPDRHITGECVVNRGDTLCFCAVGAVGYATKGDEWFNGVEWFEDVFDPYRPESSEALALLDKAAAIVSNGAHRRAYLFNDAGLRTHADVLAMFDKAIELASA